MFSVLWGKGALLCNKSNYDGALFAEVKSFVIIICGRFAFFKTLLNSNCG